MDTLFSYVLLPRQVVKNAPKLLRSNVFFVGRMFAREVAYYEATFLYKRNVLWPLHKSIERDFTAKKDGFNTCRLVTSRRRKAKIRGHLIPAPVGWQSILQAVFGDDTDHGSKAIERLLG